MKDPETLSDERLVAAVGAIVFASGEPVQTKEIAEALDVEWWRAWAAMVESARASVNASERV